MLGFQHTVERGQWWHAWNDAVVLRTIPMCRGEGRSGVETCPVVRARGLLIRWEGDRLEGWTTSSSSNLISKIDPFAKKFYSSSFWFRKNHGFGSLISDFSLHWNLFQRNRTFVNLKSLIISIFDSETEEWSRRNKGSSEIIIIRYLICFEVELLRGIPPLKYNTRHGERR